MKKLQPVLLYLLLTSIVYGQSTWSLKSNFSGNARYGAVAFSIGTKGYLGTGNDGTNRKDFWEWDKGSGTWTQMSDFPGAGRYQAVGFSIGNKGYIGTGAAGLAFPYTPHYTDFWEYDPSNNQWAPMNPFPGTARFGAVGFSIGNKGYVGTGFDAFTYFQNDFWEYDPSNNHWTQRAQFPGMQRMEAVGFSIGNRGYIGTGGNYMTGLLLLNDFWQYNPDSDLWISKTNFGGTGRSTAVGFSIGGNGYIGLGGDFNNVSYPDFWEYDTINNHWIQVADFGGNARWLSAAFSIGNNGYVSTGGNFTPAYKDLWEYSPVPTGINEPVDEENISIYPNPSNGRFILNDVNEKSSSLEIYNVKCENVFHVSNYINGSIVDISSMPDGIYFLRIRIGKSVLIKKIIVNK